MQSAGPVGHSNEPIDLTGHVMHPRFGKKQLRRAQEGGNPPSNLDELFDECEGLDHLTIRQLLTEAYDEDFDICQYGSSGHGLDYIKLHPAEEVCSRSLLYDTIRKFGRRKIASVFGVSLTEFLELPRDICDHMFEVSMEIEADKQTAIDELHTLK